VVPYRHNFMNTKILNEFQKKLISRVKQELNCLNRSLLNERTEGKNQSFITGEIEGTNLKIWVYRDGAEFTDLQQVDYRYEAVDYDTLELLIDGYISDLLRVIK